MALSAATYTKAGTKAATQATLDKIVFGEEVKNHELLKNAYVAYLGNGRKNLAVTKTRGLVRGGGKKPWKQKGTGRARFGSSRVPIWRGGGVTFGPTGLENYSLKINVKAKRKAIRQALSLAATEGRVNVIETFECKDGKVSQTAKLLGKMNITGSTLLVVGNKDSMVERATSNLTDLKVTQANYVNVYDVMNANNIVICRDALDMIKEWLGGDK